MRTRALIAAPRALDVQCDDDDVSFNRNRAALSDALAEIELPLEELEDTAKIVRLPDCF